MHMKKILHNDERKGKKSMKRNFRKTGMLLMGLMLILASPLTVLAAEEEAAAPAVFATFWALVPPIVAIALALITKEVYS